MSNTDDIGAIKQFRQRLEPHGIKIWNSSESRPEEVIQQLISREESGEEEQPRAEELHPHGPIDVLPEDISPIKVAHFVDGSPRTVNVGFLMGMNGVCPASLARRWSV